jgi:hypothetical protein
MSWYDPQWQNLRDEWRLCLRLAYGPREDDSDLGVQDLAMAKDIKISFRTGNQPIKAQNGRIFFQITSLDQYGLKRPDLRALVI